MKTYRPSVILFGSKPGSVVVLSILIKRGWDVKYVVPSKHISDKWFPNNTLKDFALNHNITVLEQNKIPLSINIDIIISYMYRYRINEKLLSLADKAALNFHPHPLPEYSGYGGYNIAILEGAKEFGCTCHKMIEEFDAGPIVKKNYFPIKPTEETAYSLEKKSQEEMIRLFIDVCLILESGREIVSTPQDEKKRRWTNKEQIDLLIKIPNNSDEETIDRYARAFWYPPNKGAYIEVDGKKVEVIPKIAREQLGSILHQDDLERLEKVANSYNQFENE